MKSSSEEKNKEEESIKEKKKAKRIQDEGCSSSSLCWITHLSMHQEKKNEFKHLSQSSDVKNKQTTPETKSRVFHKITVSHKQEKVGKNPLVSYLSIQLYCWRKVLLVLLNELKAERGPGDWHFGHETVAWSLHKRLFHNFPETYRAWRSKVLGRRMGDILRFLK